MITAKEANDFTKEKIQDIHRRKALKNAWEAYCNYRKIKKELLPRVEKEIIKKVESGSYSCLIRNIEYKKSPYLKSLLQHLGYEVNEVIEQNNWDISNRTNYFTIRVSWYK